MFPESDCIGDGEYGRQLMAWLRQETLRIPILGSE